MTPYVKKNAANRATNLGNALGCRRGSGPQHDMGAFFTNIQLRTGKIRAVDAAIKELIGGEALRSRALGGWTSIYDEMADSQDLRELKRLAGGLSQRLQTVAVAFLVHDSSQSITMLFDGGQHLGTLACGLMALGGDDPSEGALDAGPPLTSTDLLRHAKSKNLPSDVEELLRADRTDGRYLLEECRIRQLADFFGIPAERALTGFTYLNEEGHPETGWGLKRQVGDARQRTGAHRQSLLSAIVNGDAARVAKRLASGADPNERHILAQAMSMGHDEIVGKLLDAGADLAIVEDAVALATNCSSSVFSRVLAALKLTQDDLNAALFHACGRAAATQNLQALLVAGAQPNVMIDGGITPLMSAASWRNLPGVRALLTAGAWASVRSTDGRTAADYARLPLFSAGTLGVGGPEGDVPGIVELLKTQNS